MSQVRSRSEPLVGGPGSEILLATKLYVPSSSPRLVSRPRLLNCLNRGLAARLVLLSAPAGYGKTTLLAEWIRELRLLAID